MVFNKTMQGFLLTGLLSYLSYKFIKQNFSKKTPQPTEKTILDELKNYFIEKRKRFLKTFDNERNDNENIDECFYKEEWYLSDEKNPIEATIEQCWKNRIMIEWTPLGNVIMFYDVYKNAFAYYSNHTLMDYFLNALAMKYVLLFKCRDFFMDETISPISSPLIQIIQTADEKKDKIDKQTHRNIYSEKKDIFIDIKKPEKVKKILKPKLQQTWREWLYSILYRKVEKIEEKIDEKVPYKNKFIRVGKIEDFSFIQKPAKKSPFSGTATGFDSMFGINNKQILQKDTVSYLDYKNKKQEKIDETEENMDYVIEKSIWFLDDF
jgi:hypothetical protein